MLQQPLKIAYAISLYIVRIYLNGNCMCTMYVVSLPRPYLPKFGSHAFLLNWLFFFTVYRLFSCCRIWHYASIKPGIWMYNPCQIMPMAYESSACKYRPYLPRLALHILNKNENATPELFANYIQNYANQYCKWKCILMFKYWVMHNSKSFTDDVTRKHMKAI